MPPIAIGSGVLEHAPKYKTGKVFYKIKNNKGKGSGTCSTALPMPSIKK